MEGYQYLTAQQGPNSPVNLASPLSPLSPLVTADPTSLPAWDQVAQRAYIQAALCFPFDGDKTAAEAHIQSSLQRLGRQRRDFAGSLKADPQTGRVQLEKHSNDEIVFKVVDHGDKFPYTFAQLKDKDFAPSAFVHPDFALDGTLAPFSLVPVCQVRASFTQGGFILWVYLHHTFANGDGLRMFLECFSAQTRGAKVAHPKNTDFVPADTNTSFYSSSSASSTVEDLLKDCPEYIKAPQPQAHSPAALGTPLAHMTTGHPSTSHIPKKGHMFIFRHDRLDQLKSLIKAVQPAGQKKHPSSYVALAGLTWSHLTRARTLTEPEAAAADPSGPAKLINCVDWKKRTSRDLTKEYFGVAVALPFSQMPVEDVVKPCFDFNAIVPLVRTIEATISSINDEFVAKRTATLKAVPAEDPCSVVLDLDPRNPKHLAFNTWRYIGADVEWGIPGTMAAKPDAIRPVRGEIGMGYALILPAKKDSEVLELVITLPEKAMEFLMQDHDYMRWVDRVVE
ncbi:3'-N-debenzoyl-2'-deoxytaxol N-benzoyltransferase [Cytospora mali]|uniref:3'-N-debenzoyl-2'-deoxytaxol N-benzoyltransferase n=1 Tax=Cytospora mali TaxID=578113 RepID=A0A194V8T4_CYTMA|nr:3'-N-debenzoyl-2'-deoxytaxol N-benzoyltransferase [Valsa mali var. pyri (nom. inval.)]